MNVQVLRIYIMLIGIKLCNAMIDYEENAPSICFLQDAHRWELPPSKKKSASRNESLGSSVYIIY